MFIPGKFVKVMSCLSNYLQSNIRTVSIYAPEGAGYICHTSSCKTLLTLKNRAKSGRFVNDMIPLHLQIPSLSSSRKL